MSENKVISTTDELLSKLEWEMKKVLRQRAGPKLDIFLRTSGPRLVTQMVNFAETWLQDFKVFAPVRPTGDLYGEKLSALKDLGVRQKVEEAVFPEQGDNEGEVLLVRLDVLKLGACEEVFAKRNMKMIDPLSLIDFFRVNLERLNGTPVAVLWKVESRVYCASFHEDRHGRPALFIGPVDEPRARGTWYACVENK